MKKYFKINYLLYVFIILTPFFDALSYFLRLNNLFNITIVLRMIIPLLMGLYVFIYYKEERLKIVGVSLIYLVYSVIHMLVFNSFHSSFSYGTYLDELEYVIKYTYMIYLLYVLIKLNKDHHFQIDKYLYIAFNIYLILIYISIITNTSNYTYNNSIGYLGWNVSGNGLSNTLILLFLLNIHYIITNKKILTLIMAFIYFIFLNGTKTTLFGSVLVIVIYLLYKYKHYLTKKVILMMILLLIVFGLPSYEFINSKRARSKNLDSYVLIDPITNEKAHIMGDTNQHILKFIQGDQMGLDIDRIKAYIKTYEHLNRLEINPTNRRYIQFIYHLKTFEYNKTIMPSLFGNGYNNHYGELTLESEIPAMLFNFGIIGFIIYLVPIIYILITSKLSIDKITLILGLFLSLFTGYVLFYTPCMFIMVLVLMRLKGGNYEENIICNH